MAYVNLFQKLRKKVFTIPIELNMSSEIKPLNEKQSFEKNFIPNDISKVKEEVSSRTSNSFLNEFTNKIDYSLYYKYYFNNLQTTLNPNDTHWRIQGFRRLSFINIKI